MTSPAEFLWLVELVCLRVSTVFCSCDGSVEPQPAVNAGHFADCMDVRVERYKVSRYAFALLMTDDGVR